MLTSPQVGPCGNDVSPDTLCYIGGHLRSSLWYFLSFLCPAGKLTREALGLLPERGASLLKACPAVASSLLLFSAHQAPKHLPSADAPLACRTGVQDFFFHLENGIWPRRRCLKIDHVDYKSKSRTQYALEQTLKTWSSLCFKDAKDRSRQLSLS